MNYFESDTFTGKATFRFEEVFIRAESEKELIRKITSHVHEALRMMLATGIVTGHFENFANRPYKRGKDIGGIWVNFDMNLDSAKKHVVQFVTETGENEEIRFRDISRANAGKVAKALCNGGLFTKSFHHDGSVDAKPIYRVKLNGRS